MTGTVEFSGAINQAAAGDLVNEGPQISNSNVVNLHLSGQASEAKLSGEHLTFQQKRSISKLVDRIVEATEAEPLEVWNQILARTGAKKVKFIPKGQYVALDVYLNDWLAKTAQPAQFSPEKPVQSVSVGLISAQSQLPQQTAHAVNDCPHCAKLLANNSEHLHQSREKTIRMVLSAIGIAGVCLGQEMPVATAVVATIVGVFAFLAAVVIG